VLSRTALVALNM